MNPSSVGLALNQPRSDPATDQQQANYDQSELFHGKDLTKPPIPSHAGTILRTFSFPFRVDHSQQYARHFSARIIRFQPRPGLHIEAKVQDAWVRERQVQHAAAGILA
jgi:hypothetical protein